VYVNGVRFDTKDLLSGDITIDGITVNESQLTVGMVLAVKGDFGATDGKATSIAYESTSYGPATNISEFDRNNPDTGTFKLFGQTVHVTPTTVLGGQYNNGVTKVSSWQDISGIADNSLYIEVSGYHVDSAADILTNEIYATRIEIKGDWTAGNAIKLKGYVDSATMDSLVIAGEPISVDASTYANKYVEVKGNYDPIGGFSSLNVQEKPYGLVAEEGDDIELEGIVTSDLDANNQFTLNGQLVVIDDKTELENNLQLTHIVQGAHLEVEGYFSSGTLYAEEIEPEDTGEEFSGQGTITNMSSSLKSITVNGIVLYVDNNTILKDDRNDYPEQMNYTRFEFDQFTDYKYYYDSISGKNIATKIIIKD
ncbi:MAG: hypothetical protein HUJ30_07650, partial [Gammaproteobacteria bacterium]|nr:hypothetical protein [Gammaproteobacteria bacterium]